MNHEDSRHAVYSLLKHYSHRHLDLLEATMVQEAMRFISSHSDCLHRSCLSGHVTSSAWVVDATRSKVLLTHHRKLNKWLQLGGHVDGENDLLASAMREAREESGLKHLKAVSKEIFDFDSHRIPTHADVPAHFHFDFRFLIEADAGEPFMVSDESHALAWVDLEKVETLTEEDSMLRMVQKTKG